MDPCSLLLAAQVRFYNKVRPVRSRERQSKEEFDMFKNNTVVNYQTGRMESSSDAKLQTSNRNSDMLHHPFLASGP